MYQVHSPVAPLLPHRLRAAALSLLLTALAVLPARAEYDRSFEFDAEILRVGNLIGAVTVEGHGGSDFVVEVRVRGRDADDGVVEFVATEGREAELMVVFPKDERRYVYPALGRGSRSTFNPGRSRGWWNEVFGKERIEVRGSGNGLEVWADLTVKVPRGGELVLGNGAGTVKAEGVNGALELTTRVGAVDAREIAGALKIDTGSGHVDVDGVRGDLLVDTGSGHVGANDVEGSSISIDTGSGHVELTLANAPQIVIDTGSGKVRLDRITGSSVAVDTGSGGVDARDVAADRVDIDTGSGSVDVQLTRMGEGNFVVDTGSGSITFVMPEDASAHVQAETGSGGIDVELQKVDFATKKRDHVEFEVGSGAAKVVLDTGSGRIRIASR